MSVMTTMPPRLGEAFERVQSDIDSAFDAFLPVPDDSRARLVEAMRYAAIGAGKRMRPLLLVATSELFGVNRNAAINAGCAVEAPPAAAARPRSARIRARGAQEA